MKTVIHQTMDGLDIVRGFGVAAVDNAALFAKIQPALAASDEVAACAALSKSIYAAALALERATTQAEYTAARENCDALMKQSPVLAAALDARRRVLVAAFDQDPSIYFPPGPLPDGRHEDLILDPRYSMLKASVDALPQGGMLMMDGVTIQMQTAAAPA